MYRILTYIFLIFIFICGNTQTVLAQQGSAPIGVNFILVNFSSPPSTLSVEQAPLKYNKDFALSMQVDDAHESLYEIGFPVFEGGLLNGTPYPGLYYSNGCGDSISFKMGASVYVFNNNGENGPDVHVDNSYSQLTWEQMDTLYKSGWGIYNHAVNGNKNSNPLFMDYSIKRNRSYIRRKLFTTTDGGVITNLFVNPGGDANWSIPSFNLGNIGALNQNVTFPLGVNGGNVNNTAVNWTQPYNLYRNTEDEINVTSFTDGLASASTGGDNYWAPFFTHKIGTEYATGAFIADFTYIAGAYGIGGADNILMTTDEEILDYLIVRDATSVNHVINGTTLLITFSGNVPDDLRYYSSSVVIESDATIASIIVDGTTDYTYNGIGTSDALINLNWDGRYIIPAEYLADSMVTIASGTNAQYDCWIAMDYVITLENGPHKDSLREVLCNIPNVSYDDGFCDCNISLQPSDTTILLDSCIYLVGAIGDYTYEWFIGDSLIDTIQDIYRCPIDTTMYTHIATNSYGCAAEDSILVNVHSFTFSLGPDKSICEGSCDTLVGPVNMKSYQWYAADTLLPDSTSSIVVCPPDTTEYILIVQDSMGYITSDSIILNVIPSPEVTIQPIDSTINFGDCIDLYGPDTNYVYNWYIGDSLLPDTTYTIITCPEDTTLYTLVVTDTTTGCSAEDSTWVYINFLSFDLGPDDTICQYECREITGPPDMVKYEWWVADTIYATTQEIEPCPEETTMYTLWVENDVGATAEDSITLFTLPTPSAWFDVDTIQTCIGNDLEITVNSSPDVVQYNWFLSFWDTTSTVNTITIFDIEAEGNLNVYAYAENQCFGFAQTYIDAYPYPPLYLTPDTSLCAGDSIELTMTGGTNFFWMVGEDTISTNSSVFVTPEDTTVYIARTSFDNLYCFTTDSVVVDVFHAASTKINYDYDTNYLCTYDSVELYATGAYSYLWSPGGDTTENYSFLLTDTTTITLLGTTENGCVASDSVTFYNKPVPEVSFTGLLPAFCISDSPVELTGEPPGGTFSSNGPIIIGNNFIPQDAGAGEFEVYYTYTDEEYLCTGVDTNVTIVYNNGGTINLGDDFYLHPDSTKGLDAGAGFDSYLWTTGATTRTILIKGTDKPPGIYQYSVMGIIGGCSTRGNVYVTFGATGYSDDYITNLSVYPNPNTGKFAVRFNTKDSKPIIRIYDIHGSEVYENSELLCTDDCSVNVDIQDLPAGYYILKIITSNGISTTNIVLK